MRGPAGPAAEAEFTRFVQASGEIIRAKLAEFAEGPDHLEDLLQATWLRCLRRWDQLREGDRIAWAVAVARSIAIDDYRGRRRRRSVSMPPPEPSSPQGPTRIELDAVRRELGRTFQVLTKREKEVIRLRFLSERSTADVAVQLGISESTTRVHLANALRKMRAAYRKDEA